MAVSEACTASFWPTQACKENVPPQCLAEASNDFEWNPNGKIHKSFDPLQLRTLTFVSLTLYPDRNVWIVTHVKSYSAWSMLPRDCNVVLCMSVLFWSETLCIPRTAAPLYGGTCSSLSLGPLSAVGKLLKWYFLLAWCQPELEGTGRALPWSLFCVGCCLFCCWFFIQVTCILS